MIADHIRAIAFTIADGQLPSNTGAGYVIRRILRRAVRYYYSYLDRKEPMLHILMPGLAEQFKDVFPELLAQVSFVSKVVKEEEETFLRTLGKGLKKIDEMLALSKAGATIEGAAAFELYDTYGFPIDLTRLIALENGMQVDEQGFEKEMQVQKTRSRAATAADVEDWIEVVAPGKAGMPFIGYTQLDCVTSLLRYRKVTTKGQSFFQLVLEQTPFYAESGGQIGDTGTITMGGQLLEILNTKKENDLIVHTVATMPDKVIETVEAAVDVARRKEIARHHSLTHLIHAALRIVLGEHVVQKGSLVSDKGMRFDFSHFAKMTDEELAQVTDLVNKKIRSNVPVVITEMPKAEAIQLGAMALFGEKYGSTVRVVTIDPVFSNELCGGTHVGSTGELGHCLLVAESGVAAGVRRIEAICSSAFDAHLEAEHQVMNAVRVVLKNPRDLVKAAEQQALDLAMAKKQLDQAERRLIAFQKKELLASFTPLAETYFLGERVDASSAEALRTLCNELRNTAANAVVILGANINGKPSVAVGLADALSAAKGMDAVVMIKSHVAEWIKGGGGGQKTLATAGGQDPDGLQKAIDQLRQSLS